MKSIAILSSRSFPPSRARRVCGGLATALLIAACQSGGASSASTPVPQPVAGDVERVQFAPSLGIHLDSMSRRASGMYVQDLAAGSGAVATLGRTVVVRYTGWFSSGEQFDSGEITVTLGTHKTIEAWEQGLLGMRVGGKRRLIVPPALAYGASGNGRIPPNAVLVFEMDMLSIP